LKLADHPKKLQIRDELQLIAYPQTTLLSAPVKDADTKGAKKRKKSAISANSTAIEPSWWEKVSYKRQKNFAYLVYATFHASIY
jgi:hypothetical protein